MFSTIGWVVWVLLLAYLGRPNDTERLEHMRTHGMIRTAGREGVYLLPERVRTLDALREAIDDDIEAAK